MDPVEETRDLKSQHNAKLPVAKLPYETITSIFEIIVLEARDSSIIIPITHVSQYWRHAAIEYPALWGHIRGTTTPLDMLSRSKDAPLFVQVSAGGLGNSRVLNSTFASFISQNSHRLREISVNSPAWAIEAISRLLNTPPPYLEVIRLINQSFIVSATVTELFHHQNSSLRDLYLHALDVNWDGLCLSQLTSLSLSAVHVEILELLQLLLQMQNLQHLVLSHCEQSQSAATYLPHREQTVFLQKLCRLKVSGTSDSCLPLFGHLNFPSSTSIDLEIDITTQPPSISLFSMAMHRIFESDRQLLFSAHDRSLQFSSRDHHVFQMDQVEDLRSYALAGFRAFTSVKSLYISTSALSIGEEDWREIFQLLEGLVTLGLQYDIYAQSVVRAVRRFAPDPENRVLLPALDQLDIQIYNLKVFKEEEMFQLLLEFLQERRDRGMMIIMLKFVFDDVFLHLACDSPLVQEKVGQLSSLVQHLECVDMLAASYTGEYCFSPPIFLCLQKIQR